MRGILWHKDGSRRARTGDRGNVAGDKNESFLLTLAIPSDPELLCVVRGAVQQLAELVGMAEEECRAVTLAVDEALTNVIRHAYQDRRGQPIEISCRRLEPGAGGRSAAGLEFVLVDRGRGVDPAELHGRPLEQVRPGGLGTHFIKEIMDEVEYERGGSQNRLRLVKYLGEKRSP